jgi:hypothetical protein
MLSFICFVIILLLIFAFVFQLNPKSETIMDKYRCKILVTLVFCMAI